MAGGKIVVMTSSDAAAVQLRLAAVAFDVTDAPATAAFWAELLGREAVTESGAVLVPGDETQVGLRFARSDTELVGRPRLHLHLTSTSLEHQERTVEMALRLGGRHLDVGQSPDDDFVVLADPGGNELCVIEPGNKFLDGTGFLGEVTCNGTRTVGLFWRDALGWPLVWDEDEQTAIQSPLGGTKISWTHGRNRSPGPRTDGAGSASTSSAPTPPARPNDSSRWARASLPARPTTSSWWTRTATSSACTARSRAKTWLGGCRIAVGPFVGVVRAAHEGHGHDHRR
jgi:catechol 2,3-dioxygenase-like lactoylglutathione lyase family enzyme